MKPFEYVAAKNLDQVFEQLDSKGAVVKAGGIDLLDLAKEGIVSPKRLVSIRDLADLKEIKPTAAGGLSIGSAVTLAEIAADKNINKNFRALAQAAKGAATPQIRNSATLAGNLCQRPRCWYFRSEDFNCVRKGGDSCFADDGENQYHAIFGNNDGCVIVHPSATAVALAALGAQVTIRSKNEEREIPVLKLFVAPGDDVTKEHILKQGEIITDIKLPALPAGYSSYYSKLKEKQSFDWPLADAAVVLNMPNGVCRYAKITLGSAAPIPWRLVKAEQALIGQKISVQKAKEIAEDALADATPLSLNAYKIPVFKAVLYRTICKAAGIDPFV